MTKIMLVEDDNNLREIYEARLAAEGYTIVSAQDGEAALALAAKERPDLIISDVMMPKISGFEMLDILRNTENLRDIKVIMLTALGQSEDNARAGALGANRYLVKSQVTLEDIVKTTHDVLEEISDASPAGETPSAPAASETKPEERQAKPWTSAESQPAEPTASEPAAQPIEVVEPAPIPDPAAAPTVESPETTSEAAPSENTSEEQAEAQSEAASDAKPAAQEESVMRAQIDSFLGDSGTDQQAQSQPASSSTDAAEPALTPTPTTDDSGAASDQSQPTAQSDDDPGTINATEPPVTQPPSDEADAEYDKDAATPDKGELSIHTTEPEQTEPQSAPTEQSAPPSGYPSQPFELPVVPEATVAAAPAAQPASQADPYATPQPADQPSGAQSSGDRVISDAINDMIASTPSTTQAAPPPPPPVQSVGPQDGYVVPSNQAAPPPPAGPPAQPATSATEPASAPSDTPPPQAQPQQDTFQGNAPIAHKRVIAPIDIPSRPDINQLMALEESKAAAAQAGAYGQGQPNQPPQGPPQPQAGQYGPPQQQPQPNYGPPPVDPNSISL